MSTSESRGERLVAPGAVAKEIDPSGRVKFVHEALPQGVMWVEAHHRPGGVTRDEVCSAKTWYQYDAPQERG